MTTRELVKEIRIKNPCATLQQIGDKVGLTRERVRQILNLGNLPTKHYHQDKRKMIACLNCGKPTPNAKYCGFKCSKGYNQIQLVCRQCGNMFYRTKSYVMTKGNNIHSHGDFCNKKCSGKYIGIHYGFGVHPENVRLGGIKNGTKRKWDYEYIYSLRHSGMKRQQIIDLLKCPQGTYDRIIAKMNKAHQI